MKMQIWSFWGFTATLYSLDPNHAQNAPCILMQKPSNDLNLIQNFEHYFFRLHLDQNVIKFEEFYSQFRESVSSEYPRWLDPVARAQTEKANMNASQVKSTA